MHLITWTTFLSKNILYFIHVQSVLQFATSEDGNHVETTVPDLEKLSLFLGSNISRYGGKGVSKKWQKDISTFLAKKGNL